MERRAWLRWVGWSMWQAFLAPLWTVGLIVIGKLSGTIWAQGPAEDPLRIDDTTTADELERTLKAGIKARRPAEVAFVEMVVGKVQRGELPPGLVRSSFMWARKQPRNQAVYFEQVLRRLADRANVALPSS